MVEGKRQKTVVVGAGPVGALAALYAASRGDDVEVYELRGDLRDSSTVPLNFTKSINLAFSERGRNALEKSDCPGLLDAVLNESIPMQGRMIHGQKQGELYEEPQSYDVHGRFIRAIDRAGLNKRLLDQLGKMPNVKLLFNHKLVGADFKRNLAWFERRDPSSRTDQVRDSSQLPETDLNKSAIEVEVSFDFMIGADGAHSATRYHLMKFARMFYQQQYIDTLWCEFHVPRSQTGGFRISPNHLHIWPGGSFMFIALPNLDKTFTSTLFLPASRFAELDGSPERLVPFFKRNFPGVVPDLITAEELQAQYVENPHLPLISIKCAPYHFSGSVVIIGDAAHAMVPFYGQGMNAGLEDVRVLYNFLDKFGVASAGSTADAARLRADALSAYTEQRTPDAHSINDLALRNYQEMRSDVKSPVYKLRKSLEEALDLYFPSLGWATQYSRVSFGNERYSLVEQRAHRQANMLLSTAVFLLAMGLSSASWWTWRLHRDSGLGRGFARLGAWVGTSLANLGRRPV